ncbi:MAG TPA: GNAT family N-acetyltransferase [Ignavibacteriaceae bacterium]|nr:GNAT family N-acetyltransferase [Ignavibacteriaceae bacterium]
MLTKDKLKIRQANNEDTALILSLIKEIAEYEKLGHEVSATEKDIKNNLFGEKRYAEVLIAEYDEEPAGQALFFHNFSTFVGRPGIYLEDLFVRPKFRGKGIGKSLLLELIKLAEERKCGRVEWCVLDWNEPAIKFYKKLGAVSMDGWSIFRVTEDKFSKILINSTK